MFMIITDIRNWDHYMRPPTFSLPPLTKNPLTCILGSGIVPDSQYHAVIQLLLNFK